MIIRILIFIGIFLLVSCNDISKKKNSLTPNLNIVEYENIEVLELDCKTIASKFYSLHDVKISEFYQITQEFACDFNKDGYTDSIYLLTPISQLLDSSKCCGTYDSDMTILLVFKNNLGKQNMIRVYKNLFCPLAPALIYRELVFKNDVFILTKEFGFGNGRKVYSKLYFSWKKDDFYADSVETRILENGNEDVLKENLNTKLSLHKNIDCKYF